MSWLRIEGKMPTHWKVAPLSDSAFRLHITAMAWCAEHRTNGLLAKNIPQTLTRSPGPKRLASTIDELATAKLWHVLGDCYEIHDYLQWNLSTEDYERRALAGAAGGRAKASKLVASAKQVLSRKSSKTLPVSVSVSVSEEDQGSTARAPRSRRNGTKVHEEQSALGLDMESGPDQPIDEQTSPTRQIQAHYEAEFLATREERVNFGKKWPRACKSFKELGDVYGVEKSKTIISGALRAGYCKRFMPWELVDDAMKWVGNEHNSKPSNFAANENVMHLPSSEPRFGNG